MFWAKIAHGKTAAHGEKSAFGMGRSLKSCVLYENDGKFLNDGTISIIWGDSDSQRV